MPTVPKRLRELDAAIDAVLASYAGNLEIDNLELAALPNERAVIEALDHLKHVLFEGFTARAACSTREPARGLAEPCMPPTASSSSRSSAPPAGRALDGPERPELPAGAGEEVVLSLSATYPSSGASSTPTFAPRTRATPPPRTIEEVVFSYPSIEAIVAYRIAHRLFLAGVP